MISHEYKCIFVHIPKTAGTSINRFFADLHNLDWKEKDSLLLMRNWNPKVGPPKFTHLKLHEYLRHQWVSPNQFEEYYKFAFVRNPWDRVVSLYKYGDFNKFMSFKKFVKNKLPKYVKNSWFYGLQYDHIYNENQTKIDYIGRFEDIDYDFMKICENMNISDAKLPHKNKSFIKEKQRRSLKTWIKMLRLFPHHFYIIKGNQIKSIFCKGDQINSKDYMDYYDTDLIGRVEDLFRKDIEVFNYNFENTQSRQGIGEILS